MEHHVKGVTKKQEKIDLDGFSCLPDCILSHIFSFLDTKSAIRTSLLSKRFKLVWTLSPCLNFEFSGFSQIKYLKYTYHVMTEEEQASVESFKSCVYNVLKQREHTTLTKFHLSLPEDAGSTFIEDCAFYAAQHNVQDLTIYGFTELKPATLPRLLLTSSSLISLHLHNAYGRGIELPKSVILPNLKVLHLDKFKFSVKKYDGWLSTGCPNLETLILSKCWINPGDKFADLDLNSPNLKNLEIEYWSCVWDSLDDCMINVMAPRLSLFKLAGHLVTVNFKEGLPCLDVLCIDLFCPSLNLCTVVHKCRELNGEYLLHLFHQICVVKFLSLSPNTIEVISRMPEFGQVVPHAMFEKLRITESTC
ncbi:F-box/LRR-repeat protein 25-like [Primulina tabacum]|uniref:F-box/LRR-repeat protein 25-like n=1 Tax=Primulina tabacum TaxID=48773 RepID=UPI003F599667